VSASVEEVASTTNEFSGTLDSMNTNAQTMNETVQGVSSQAVDAAIEAARAGEHGRGFAVVADEVRRLAEQSSTATTDIESLIGQIQSGIAATVSGMSEGSTKTDVALDNVNQSSKIINSILGAVEEMERQVEEFTAGLEQINSGRHEIASVAKEQATSMQEVTVSAQSLMDMGAKLQELLRHFKLNS
jgi:methyl-accepting chemotaxis protein